MEESRPPEPGVPEMTQAARDEYRARFLLACYRKFGMGPATDDRSFVACGRALAEELGLDPSVADEAFLYWSRRKRISPTMQGGGHFTPLGQEMAELMLRRVEADSKVGAEQGSQAQSVATNATPRERAQRPALELIDSALAALDTLVSSSAVDSPDRISRWWENVAQRLREAVSAPEAERFSRAYSDVVPGLILGGSDAVLGAAARGRVYLTGLRADIERSPEMLEPTRSATVEPAGMHRIIESAAGSLLRDGHYSQAVFEAAKALVSAVKAKSNRADLDGAPLMRTVFSQRDPILAFKGLTDLSDADEQQGMMHLYEGAVLAVRNPRAHSPMADSPEGAQRYLQLLSFLAYRLDEATRRE